MEGVSHKEKALDFCMAVQRETLYEIAINHFQIQFWDDSNDSEFFQEGICEIICYFLQEGVAYKKIKSLIESSKNQIEFALKSYSKIKKEGEAKWQGRSKQE